MNSLRLCPEAALYCVQRSSAIGSADSEVALASVSRSLAMAWLPPENYGPMYTPSHSLLSHGIHQKGVIATPDEIIIHSSISTYLIVNGYDTATVLG